MSGQGVRAASPLTAAPDFVVTSDAEWDALFANEAAVLAGRIVELRGAEFTQREIANKDFDAAGGILTIRGADSAAMLPGILFNGTVRGIDFCGVNFQMTGWPSAHRAPVFLNSGTFGKLRFINGCTFRHGYGAGLTDLDTLASLPEYDRIDNVQTATTSSATYPLAWKDGAAALTGWIEFFNRGPEPVRVEVGGPDVNATGASPLVNPGARRRISSGVTPSETTHFAVLATTGTSEVNARTEIGLSEYLAQAFWQTGAATLEDIEIRNCLFRDLNNGVKGVRPTSSAIVMDCDFDRIYQDIIAIPAAPGAELYIFRNLESPPFARSGIAEGLNGDARDPHGDHFQMWGDGTATVGPVYYGGNRVRLAPRREGVQSQGIFVSDNDFDPCYTDLFFISTMQIAGAGRALSLGEAGTPFKVRDAFVYGATILDPRDLSSTGPFVTIDHDDQGTIYVGKTIAPRSLVTDAPWQEDGNLMLETVADVAAVFPHIAGLSAAQTRAEIEAAMVTAAKGENIGAIATRDAIDWSTSNPAGVIRWENLPSGAHWNNLINAPADNLVTFPLRRILNQRPSQTVSVGTGTQWRKMADDGTTQLQDWTGDLGTIEPGQFIQIRTASSAIGGQTVSASVMINGFEQVATVRSAALPSAFLVQGSPIGHFVDPANAPSGTTRMTFRGKFYLPSSLPGAATRLFMQSSTGCDAILQSTGAINVTIEDGTGFAVLLNAPIAPAGTIIPDKWHELVLDVDHVAQKARLTVNDTFTFVVPFANAGNGVFQNNRQIGFLATATGGTALPAGSRFADLSVDLNGVRHKTIPNDAASANADPWKVGGDVSNA